MVYGLGFMVYGCALIVESSGFRIQGFGLGFRF